MTWDELKEKAKEMGAEIIKGIVADLTYEVIVFEDFRFYRDGQITYPDFLPPEERHFVSKNRTPSQMFAMMKVLHGYNVCLTKVFKKGK